MAEDRELVEATWELVKPPVKQGKLWSLWAGWYKDGWMVFATSRTCAGAWREAAERTRERLEKVRQLMEDEYRTEGRIASTFSTIQGQIARGEDGPYLAGDVADLCSLYRILARTEAAFAEAKRGMKA